MGIVFFVFNTILFFLKITTIYTYIQHNVSHSIADFSALMGHKYSTCLLVNGPARSKATMKIVANGINLLVCAGLLKNQHNLVN